MDEGSFLLAHKVVMSTLKDGKVKDRYAVFGIARMFEIFNSMRPDPAQTRVFRDVTEALAWLSQANSDCQ